MGNKANKQLGNKATPYKLSIEFYGAKVMTGQSIRGQAVLSLEDVYHSEGGLDSATLTLIGLERTKFCE